MSPQNWMSDPDKWISRKAGPFGGEIVSSSERLIDLLDEISGNNPLAPLDQQMACGMSYKEFLELNVRALQEHMLVAKREANHRSEMMASFVGERSLEMPKHRPISLTTLRANEAKELAERNKEEHREANRKARLRRDNIVLLVKRAIDKAGAPSDLGALLGFSTSLINQWKLGVMYSLPDDATVARIAQFVAEPAVPVEPIPIPRHLLESDPVKARRLERLAFWKKRGG